MATPADHQPRGREWQELLVTVLLAVAAVATAWSSYQAARWHGEQAEAASRTNAVRIEAARAAGLSEAQREVDVATFIAWVDADGTGEKELASFYQSRFRPEFKTAFDAWVATNPFENTNAPSTPFTMPEYQVASMKEAERLDNESEAAAAEVRTDIQRASNYVLSVVLYAVAMFLAGMSTKLTSRRLRTTLMVSGYIVLIASLSWIATFPVSLAI